MEQPTEDQKKRAKECGEKVNEVLKSFNCVFSPSCIINQGGITMSIPIVALPSVIEATKGMGIIK